MSAFNGKAFMLGIQHLDASSRELFDRHARSMSGRWRFVEQLTDDAMLRLVGGQFDIDYDSADREA